MSKRCLNPDTFFFFFSFYFVPFLFTHIIFSFLFNLKPKMTQATPALLADAFSEHVNATVRLAKVALELEWTIFTRFTVGVITATILSTFYLVLTLRNSKRPLVVWEKLNKPLIKLFRPKIFSFLLGNMNPYSASIGTQSTLVCLSLSNLL